MENILSILVFFPAVAGLLGFIVDKESARAYGITVATIEFFLSLWLWFSFDTSNAGMQFVEMIPLIPDMGISYYLGVDGISLFIILMTTLMTLIGMASMGETKNIKNMIVTLLFLEMTMVGVFVALDAIIFYLFWELSLVPMLYIVGAWGGPLRIYASIKFFLYTFTGSLIMLVGMLFVAYIYHNLTGVWSFAITDWYALVLPVNYQLWLFAAFFIGFAIKVPMFPFHIFYVKVLTRAPRNLTVAASLLMPIFGVLGAAVLIPKLPQGALSAVGTLAAIGAVWGSIKAIAQVRVPLLLAYAGLALYSVFWWHIAQVGGLTPHSILYIAAVTLALGGLTYGWDRLRVRYGDLDLNQIGGLIRPMPIFALCMGLLIMALAGLPPFALFFSYLVMLFSPGTTMSAGLVAVVAAWFAASWYMFGLMKRLLFGPHRTDLHYEDLGPNEIGCFVVVIVLLILLSGVPLEWMDAGGTMLAQIQGVM